MKNIAIITLATIMIFLSSCGLLKPIVLTDSEILNEFAGDYAFSTGYWSYSLSIRSDNTFRAEVFTDMGDHLVYNGGISIQNSQITLLLDDEASNFFDEVYLPTRWERRKYLIDLDKIVYFCESIQSSELRTEMLNSPFGSFFLERGVSEKYAGGVPISPSGETICH